MDLNWLEDFVCLAQTQNFTRAAVERNITQSAFSRRVKSLESWLGADLIVRSTYPVQLSQAGEDFLPIARNVISDLTSSRKLLSVQSFEEKGFQRFAALPTLSVNFLASKIVDAERQIKGLKARVLSESLGVCCKLLADGNCDFLICFRHPDVKSILDEDRYDRKDVGVEKLIPVVQKKAMTSNGWEFSHPIGKSLPYLAYDRSSFLGLVVEHILKKHHAELDAVYVDDLAEAIKQRALSGAGVAWLPKSSILTELKSGKLVQIGDEHWEADLDISLYCTASQLDEVGQQIWKKF